MNISFSRECSNCSTLLHYKNLKTYSVALKKGTVCPSCRTSKNNKSENRNAKGANNPSWKGFGDVPGKVFYKLKQGAAERNLDFDLSIEDINDQWESQHKLCAFTRVPLAFGENASVDRINSKLGYNRSNIQIVHKDLNMMKKDLPNEVFIAWCKLVAKHGEQ